MKRPALGPRGRAFWNHATTTYVFSEAEVQILSEICKTMDLLDALAATIAADGVVVIGSRDQERANPAIAESRQQRLALSRLISQLRLPDAAGEEIKSHKALAAVDAGRAAHRSPRQALTG